MQELNSIINKLPEERQQKIEERSVELIAEHLLYKFLNDKFDYCGAPLHKGKLDYIDRTLTLNKLKWIVHMFIDKHQRYKDWKPLLENKIVAAALEFMENERSFQQ